MLEVTLTSRFAPSTNLKGDVPGANWVYLLPSRELKHLLIIGRVSESALRAVAGLAERVSVLCPTAAIERTIDAHVAKYALANVNVKPLTVGARLDVADGSIDAVAIPQTAVKMCDLAWLSQELPRVLAAEGRVFVEFGRARKGVVSRKVAALAKGLPNAEILCIAPADGREIRTAYPDRNPGVKDFFRRHKLDVAPHPRGWRKVLKIVAPAIAERLTPRGRAALLAPVGSSSGGPPQYLQKIAAQAGVDLSDYQWGVMAHSGYSSRKVIFFLIPPGKHEPHYVAKLPRAAMYNGRLENERRALVALDQTLPDSVGVIPSPAFFGHHAGLAVLGQTAVHGRSFASTTEWSADCTRAKSVIEMLTQIASATTTWPAAGEVEQALTALYEQCKSIYALSSTEQRFLESQIGLLSDARLAMPAVFQHGDPGTWNVLITAGNRPALLDWEAAEPLGMPLWDLFYFLRSFGVGAARSSGVRDNLKACHLHFVARSAFTSLMREAVDEYCDRAGVPRSLAEALFYTCWMHRALKEATRLAPHKLARGHYINLLKMCIAQRQGPALRNLLGQGELAGDPIATRPAAPCKFENLNLLSRVQL